MCVFLRETDSEGEREKKIEKKSERENAIPARGDVTFVVYARLCIRVIYTYKLVEMELAVSKKRRRLYFSSHVCVCM